MRAVLPALVAAVLALAPSAQAAHVDDVDQGSFYGVGDANTALWGSAKLVRFDDDTTMLRVRLHGLEPRQTYPVHLHSGACADEGPHYRHEPDGPAAPPNELWASSDPDDPKAGITADRGGQATGSGTAPWRAGPKARSVFIHSGDKAIGCADLS